MARPRLHERVAELRAQREALGRRRVRRTVSRRDGTRCEVDGSWLTAFCGNDYLGLAQQSCGHQRTAGLRRARGRRRRRLAPGVRPPRRA